MYLQPNTINQRRKQHTEGTLGDFCQNLDRKMIFFKNFLKLNFSFSTPNHSIEQPLFEHSLRNSFLKNGPKCMELAKFVVIKWRCKLVYTKTRSI